MKKEEAASAPSAGVLSRDGEALLRYAFVPPPLPEARQAARRLSRCYRAAARSFLRALKRSALPLAARGRAAELAAGRPYILPEYRLVCTAERAADVYSVLRTYSVSGGGRSVRRMAADVWNAETGWPLTLGDFFPRGVRPRRAAAKALAAEAARRAPREPYLRALGRRRLRRRIRRDNWYRRADGLVFFFSPGEAAPAEAGFLEFVLRCPADGARERSAVYKRPGE